MRTYATLAELKDELGITDTDSDDRLARALVAATRIVDVWIGAGTAADDDYTGDASDLVVVDPRPAALVEATIYAAVRIKSAPSAPFGVAGMSDQGIVAYVRSTLPDLPLILMGRQASWGIG
jgi:hypothetical protein